jgi:hypothetical protein
MPSAMERDARRQSTRSIQGPDRSVNAARLSSLASHSVSKRPIWLVEVLELGTAARHNDGEVALTLPPDTCWAYRDEGQATVD